MRELKFRAWDNIEEKMINLCWEDLGEIEAGTFNEIGKDIFIMQFTGLYDKNGKEIYERDIVKYKNINCEIDFNIQLGSWRIEGTDNQSFISHTFHHQIAEECEIIGNIHKPKYSEVTK